MNSSSKPVPTSLPTAVPQEGFVAAAPQHFWQRVRNWLRPATPWVALLGVDGSGKTTVLTALAQSLATTPYTGLYVIHRRPRLAYHTATQSGPISHYAKPPHTPFRSILKLGAIGLDWLLGYWFQIRWRQAQGILVVADRHALLDLLADPLRYRYAGPAWLVRLWLRLLPRPDAVILLDAPVAVLQARKTELSVENAAALRSAYLHLIKEVHCHVVVDASQPIAQVVAEVYQTIIATHAHQSSTKT